MGQLAGESGYSPSPPDDVRPSDLTRRNVRVPFANEDAVLSCSARSPASLSKVDGPHS